MTHLFPCIRNRRTTYAVLLTASGIGPAWLQRARVLDHVALGAFLPNWGRPGLIDWLASCHAGPKQKRAHTAPYGRSGPRKVSPEQKR